MGNKRSMEHEKLGDVKVTVSNKHSFKDYRHTVAYSDTFVTEKYWIESSGFSTEVRFRKVDGKWFLVYLNDVNL